MMSTNENSLSSNRSRFSPGRLSWNPYAVGAGIGILSWLVFLVVNKPLGMSTEISKFSGWIAGIFMGQEAMVQNAYWAEKTPAFGYSTVFLIFTFLGSFFSARLSGDFFAERVPPLWEKYQGPGIAKRMIAAFIGGALLLYGARMAGGCTSGHGISGTMQLALSSWLFFPVMFVSGIVTAKFIFRRKVA